MRAPVQLVVPDPAYALTPGAARGAAGCARGRAAPGSRYLAVCPRPWLGRTGICEPLGEALERAAAALRPAGSCWCRFQESPGPAGVRDVAARPGFAGRARRPRRRSSSPALLAGVLGGAETGGGHASSQRHTGRGGRRSRRRRSTTIPRCGPSPRRPARSPGRCRSTSWRVGHAPPRVSRGWTRRIAGHCSGDLPARRAALARAVAPLRAEAGRTAGLAVQLAASGGLPEPR